MMAARYKHETGQEDNTFCIHCGLPRETWDDDVCNLKPNLTPEQPVEYMSIRDHFAMAALTGIIAAHAHPEANGYATDVPLAVKSAYEYADAMMDARDAK